jgi:hypothetical protein
MENKEPKSNVLPLKPKSVAQFKTALGSELEGNRAGSQYSDIRPQVMASKRRVAQDVDRRMQESSPVSNLLYFDKNILDGPSPWLDVATDSPQEHKKPAFPFVILIIAGIKDLVDLGDGGFLGAFISFIATAALAIWFMGKLNALRRVALKASFKAFYNRIIKVVFRRFVLRWLIFAGIAEFIPLINLFPWTVFFVLMAHHRETKFVNLMIHLTETVAEAKISAIAKEIRSFRRQQKELERRRTVQNVPEYQSNEGGDYPEAVAA